MRKRTPQKVPGKTRKNSVSFCVHFLSGFLVVLVSISPAGPATRDTDGDGLGDGLEQELLVKFAPKFMISTNECDSLPAEFFPGSPQPSVRAKNGTVYGQVSGLLLPGRPGAFIEIHYYHLWDRDCGRVNGHALDAEHVSALLRAEKPSESAGDWKAEYWYAAAHEDTACDASHAVRSSDMNAEEQGPVIWISAGKHASYLNRQLCDGGCGSDDCKKMQPMLIQELINLGEQGMPANGAVWIESTRWRLGVKMQSDFPPALLARLDSEVSPGVIAANESQAPVKTAILVGGSTAGALVSANQKTGDALTAANNAVGKSMDHSTAGIGRSLKRAARAFWGAMRKAVP